MSTGIVAWSFSLARNDAAETGLKCISTALSGSTVFNRQRKTPNPEPSPVWSRPPVIVVPEQNRCPTGASLGTMADQLNLPRDSGVYSLGGASSSNEFSYRKGSLIVHGTNGRLPGGNRGRKSSRIDVVQFSSANGVKPGRIYPVKGDVKDLQGNKSGAHCVINWKVPGVGEFFQEFERDSTTDLFQIGRGSDLSINMVVIDTNDAISYQRKKPSAVSRFACRLHIKRDVQPTELHLFAACFDEKNKMFLGEKAIVWRTEDAFDALTTNGVLVLHIQGDFIGGDATPGLWREVSVMGDIYSIRESRSSQQKGRRIQGESNRLLDGSMIDLCGVTLVWRTPESLARGPKRSDLDAMLQALTEKKYICPEAKVPLRFTYGTHLPPPNQTPHVYLGCGHVTGMNRWGNPGDELQCPVCLKVCTFASLTMSMEPGFWVDSELPTHAFNPCGHMSSEKTVKYWARVPLPRGTNGFIGACPFCSIPLVDYPGYCVLKFTVKEPEP